MTLSTSRLAYDDCFAVMMAALADDTGVRVRMADIDAAIHFRMRCHQARKIDREDNAATYPEGHPLCGRSELDRITIRMDKEDDEVYLRFERTKVIPGEVTSLATGEQLELDLPQLPAAPAPKALPPPDLGAAFDAVEVVDGEVVDGPAALPEVKGSFRRI